MRANRRFILLLVLAAVPAWAHQQQGQAAGFLAGLRHPVSGLDHVLAMVSVGLWGAQLGPPAIWLLPVTFPLVMAFVVCLREPWTRIAVRVAGSWIAATGLLMLGWRLSGRG